jgi:tetratricopeptide (TPR) repeat protein
MKTEQILTAAKTWAKQNGFKIKAKILKTAPEWVRSENESQGAGVAVTIPEIDPIPCEIWLQESAGKVFILRKSKAWEIYRIKNISEVGKGLTNAVETHRVLAMFDIIEEWANANGYEIGDQSLKEGYDDSYEYGRKDDPHVQEGFYPSTISFTSEGKLNVERKIGESRPRSGGRTGSWFSSVASGNETKPDNIMKWLDENAKTGFYKDHVITYLDKKTAKRIIRDNRIPYADIHLYELEAATDEAIEVLCKYDGKLTLSEKSFLSLTDAQIQKLIENTNLYYRKKDTYCTRDLIIEIGIFLQGEIPEAVCKKMIKHPISKHGSNSYYLINQNVSSISEKCAAILARASSEIRYADSSVERAVEIVGRELIESINEDHKKIPLNDFPALLKHHKSAYVKLKKVLGENHYYTIQELERICDAQVKLGKLDNALATQKMVVDIRLRIEGPSCFLESPERDYALLLCKLERFAEAVPILQRLWKEYLEHGKAIGALPKRLDKASSVNKETKKKSEISLLLDKIKREQLGNQKLGLNLCGALAGIKEYDEAIRVINQAIKISTEVHGAENLETLELLAHKAYILIKKGDLSGAVKILSRVYTSALKQHGPAHEFTISIMDRYACELHNLALLQKRSPNKYTTEADVLYQKLLKHYRRTGGEDHEDAIRISENLEYLLSRQ